MVQFDIEENITGEKKLVCSFSERLDTENCSKFEDEIYQKVQESKIPVIFDLQHVDYVSSAFLRICLQVSRKVGIENLSIINVHPNVKRVFKIAGFDKQITVQ